MSENRPQLAAKETPLRNARFLVIASRWNGEIVDELVAGALAQLSLAKAKYDKIEVPGALEIAVAAAIKLGKRKYDGVIALGCVIRGETEHFEIVAHQSARALLDLAVARRIALGNGILTVDTEAQAWARAKRSEGNAGGYAAAAALSLARLAKAKG
jgi:6,7-dimethyl-8-ribityllumazine synthase